MVRRLVVSVILIPIAAAAWPGLAQAQQPANPKVDLRWQRLRGGWSSAVPPELYARSPDLPRRARRRRSKLSLSTGKRTCGAAPVLVSSARPEARRAIRFALVRAMTSPYFADLSYQRRRCASASAARKAELIPSFARSCL